MHIDKDVEALEEDRVDAEEISCNQSLRVLRLPYRELWGSNNTRVVLTPLMAPRANAHAERWIGSCRRDCLDWMLIVNQRHLQAVLSEYCAHYNDERPHRSRNLRPPASFGNPTLSASGRIERNTRLGGLLSEYRYAPAVA